MSRNSCFPRKELLSSIFFKIVSRDKNINAIRENSEISERIDTATSLEIPSQVIRGIIDQRSPFPGRSNIIFLHLQHPPNLSPFGGIFESTTFEQRWKRSVTRLWIVIARNSKACDEAETRDASYVESTDRFPRSMHTCQSHVCIPRHGGIFPGADWIQVDRREIEWKLPPLNDLFRDRFEGELDGRNQKGKISVGMKQRLLGWGQSFICAPIRTRKL